MNALLLGLSLARNAAATGSVQLLVFNNSALSPPALVNSTVAAFGDLPAGLDLAPYRSAVWQGTLSAPASTYYRFAASFSTGYVRLWVDDHLLLDSAAAGGGGGGHDPAAVEDCRTVSAALAVPVPFFPGARSSRVRLEYTGTGSINSSSSSGGDSSALRLLVNGSEPQAAALSPVVAAPELRYQQERAAAERGWNTWLSGDMLTHALLPHGLALQMALRSADGTHVVSMLGNDGPKCDRALFPVTHGLHDQRGEYTELALVDVGGAQYRIESATAPGSGALQILVTRVTAAAAGGDVLTITADVPAAWKPRHCAVRGANTSSAAGAAVPAVYAECPGLDAVRLLPSSDTAATSGSGASLQVHLPTRAGEQVGFTAGAPADAAASLAGIAAVVAARREVLLQRINAYAGASARATKAGTSAGGRAAADATQRNETVAGLLTAISWNVIYTPYEGIVTPVFRGSPWSVSKPHNYVLFEWDTFFAALIAVGPPDLPATASGGGAGGGAAGVQLLVDPWVAYSNVIRMVKSLIADPVKGGSNGYVAGFWNGQCGEVDKSKPPVGGLVIELMLNKSRSARGGGLSDPWVVELLIDQLVMWNRWWRDTRLVAEAGSNATTSAAGSAHKLLAPGSTRAMMTSAINCGNESPVSASRCETGLDNSPLFDGAAFQDSADVIDQTDVGMTALYAADSAALASLSRAIGRLDYAAELGARAADLTSGMNALMWSEADGLYFNRQWTATGGAFAEPKVAAPTSFYPLLVGAASDAQAKRMVTRWLANATEFCVAPPAAANSSDGRASCGAYGMPSVSRSSPAFADNSYWRGRAWGPMNALVYLGLRRYPHIRSAAAARAALAAQSEATFLVEWVPNRRVMENYNSQSGVGCDVSNAVPFYHWGGLNALVPLLEAADGVR
jgi:hypothetical protein